jgi:hypothetical protein
MPECQKAESRKQKVESRKRDKEAESGVMPEKERLEKG